MISEHAAIALQRFSYGAKKSQSLDRLKVDPRSWLLEQLSPLKLKSNVPSSSAMLSKLREVRKDMKAERRSMVELPKPKKEKSTLKQNTSHQELRNIGRDIAMATIAEAIESEQSFKFRLLDFFSNHFSVSATGNRMFAQAPLLEREAIAPHITSKFEDMLIAVIQHPAMLIYLNNDVSIGDNSKNGLKNKKRGLNENLGREILELHTLGADGGYSQKDVEELAKAITGWSLKHKVSAKTSGFQFYPARHEPGIRTLLGKKYPQQNIEQGRAMLIDLARHPTTGRYISFKLARHFIADVPAPHLLTAMSNTWNKTAGDLHAVLTAMIKHTAAWEPIQKKLKTPREFVISSWRLLGAPIKERSIYNALNLLGQRPFDARSPAGYGDTKNDWDGAQALIARIEWASLFTERSRLSAVELAQRYLAPLLSDNTESLVRGAESAQQGLALLLLSPEFQRR